LNQPLQDISEGKEEDQGRAGEKQEGKIPIRSSISSEVGMIPV
jgi:hypothetical protein